MVTPRARDWARESPETLPETPKGWARRLEVHLNLGRGKGASSFVVCDETGAETPIGYMYNTKDNVSGFTLPDRDAIMTWEELRAAWPSYLIALAQKESV